MADPEFITLPPTRTTGIAAAVVALGALVLASAALQTLVYVPVYGSARFAPWVMLGLSAAMIAAASQTAALSLRAHVAAAMLTVVGGLVSAVWLQFCLSQRLISPVAFAGPPALALAAVVAFGTLPSTWRYQVARAALMDSAAESPFARPPDSPWPMVIAATIATGLCSPVILAVIAPELADRLVLRMSALRYGRWPSGSSLFVSTPTDFQYPWSPFVRYLEIEQQHVPVDADRAVAWADDIALEVALRMVTHTGERDLHAAEAAMWASDDARMVPAWIAGALRDRNVFYHLESLMSASFNPELHRPGADVHLDCDQLVYLFTHIGARLDLDMRPVPGVFHAYLHYVPPDGVDADPVVVETTAFRQVEVHGNFVNFAGAGLGDDFFIPIDWHRTGKGGTIASRALADASNLFVPANPDRVTDMITGEVAVGLLRLTPTRDVRPILEAELPNTRDYMLVSNLLKLHLAAADRALEDGAPDRALQEADRAAKLRADYRELVNNPEPDELLVRIEAYRASGRLDDARQAATAALRTYRDDFERDPWRPRTATHARVVTAATELGLTPERPLDP